MTDTSVTASASCRSIQAAHHGRPVGGPFHRRWTRRRSAHTPEVLEQEAEDRRHRRINRLRRESGALGQDLGNLRARPSPPGAAAATGPTGPGQLRRARRQRAGFWAARHRQDPRPVRPGPPAGGSWPLRPAYRLVQELLAAKRDLDLPRQLRKLDNFDFLLLDDLGYLPQGAEESEVLFTLINASADRWASRQTWSSRSGSASSPTPWPPPRRLTGSCTTPSSWSLTSPANQCCPATGPGQGGEPAKLDANRQI